MPGDGLSMELRGAELYATAREARLRALMTVQKAIVTVEQTKAIAQDIGAQRKRVDQVREMCVGARRDRMRHSPYARLVARLASMPVIEQAKGILMAQYGWSADEAFDALRQTSQRSNVKVRDLAAAIVAATQSPSRRGTPTAQLLASCPASRSVG